MSIVNTIWISTAPRTGSMWLFNITRELYRLSGCTVEPTKVLQTDREMINLAQQAHESVDPRKIWVLKVHIVVRPSVAKSKIITTHRDPRDVCISYREFMRSDFQTALTAARGARDISRHYRSYDPAYLKMVAYSDIEQRPEETIEEIARFLAVPLQHGQAEKIARKFSRATVRHRIEQRDKKLNDQLRRGKHIDPREVVVLSPTNYRAFDLKTGFQTGHVSLRRTGDWAREVSEFERDILAAEFTDWLVEFGYPI